MSNPYREEMEAGSIESARAEAAKREQEEIARRKRERETRPKTDIYGSLEELKEETSKTEIKTRTTEEIARRTAEAGPGSVYETQEYRQYVQRGEEIKQAIEEVPEPLHLITRAPEGYYYRGEDVQEYNDKVKEYNRRLRDYRRQLLNALNDYRAGLIEYDAYEVKRKAYEAQVKQYEAELKRIEPQRQAFYEYIKSVGPPEPTEEQRRRQEMGLPPTGLPGPAAVPPPGSVTEKLQGMARDVLEIYERPFEAVTNPMREEAARLGEKSVELAAEDKALAGFGVYITGTALRTSAMAFDIATFEARPKLWADVARTPLSLAFNPEARTALANEALRDPFGLAAEVFGGAYLGGKLREIPTEVEQAVKTLKAQRGSTTEGIYGVSIKEPSYGEFLKEYRAARAGRRGAPRYPAQLEEQMAGEAGLTAYPEAEVVQRTRFLGFEEVKEADVTANEKFDTLPDTRPAVSTDFEPYKPPKGAYPTGAYDKKLWRSTGAELELVTVPPETPLMPVYKPIPDVEIAPSYRPGIRYRWTEPEAATRSLLDVGKAAALKEIPLTKIKLKEIQAIKQIERPVSIEIPKIKQPQIQRLNITQIQTLELKEIQEPKQIQIQVPVLELPPIAIPEMKETPQEPLPPRIPGFMEPPQPPKRRILDIEPKKKKKKKGRRGRKGVFEVRIDVKEPDIEFKEPEVKL